MMKDGASAATALGGFEPAPVALPLRRVGSVPQVPAWAEALGARAELALAERLRLAARAMRAETVPICANDRPAASDARIGRIRRSSFRWHSLLHGEQPASILSGTPLRHEVHLAQALPLALMLSIGLWCSVVYTGMLVARVLH